MLYVFSRCIHVLELSRVRSGPDTFAPVLLVFLNALIFDVWHLIQTFRAVLPRQWGQRRDVSRKP